MLFPKKHFRINYTEYRRYKDKIVGYDKNINTNKHIT